MKILRRFAIVALLWSAVLSLQGQSCSDSNNTKTFAPASSDTAQHDSGSHFMTMSQAQTQCTYTSSSSSSQTNCDTQCTVINAQGSTLNPLGGTVSGETPGSTLSVLGSHIVAIGWNSGQASGTNAGASCTGTLGGGAVLCGPLTIGCTVNVSFNGNSFSVTSSSGTPIWTSNNPVPNVCGVVPDPTKQQNPGGGGVAPPDPCLNATAPGPTGNFGGPGGPTPGCSPIIIDTAGEGFHLTSAQAGVLFDITGSGHPIQIAWTAPGSRNAFLALPGSDGLVHNGKELFGNFTPQPESAHPNGFLALAEYDKPENGGNGDGVIDEKDAIFSRLRLWIDENHDGISQPNELHTLPEVGVYSISLRYFESRRTDDFGNQFRYKARVNPGERRDPKDETPSGYPGRWTYDVFLMTQ